jgi:antitoxin FitA
MYHRWMPKTIQIRDLDDDVYAALTRRSAEAGITVPELLRREAARLASRPTVEEWLARTRRRPSSVSRADVMATLDEQRGPWPDAGG